MPPNHFVLEFIAAVAFIHGGMRFAEWVLDRWSDHGRHVREKK